MLTTYDGAEFPGIVSLTGKFFTGEALEPGHVILDIISFD